MEKKILITGANSFIGSNLLDRLIKEDYEIHVLTRKNSNLDRIRNNLHYITNHIVDLTEKEKLGQIVKKINPNIIFHLATQGIYGGVQANEEELIKTNIFGTKNLIDACDSIDYDCFVNTGSSSEYGLKDYPMKESDVCIPANMYGLTKNMATKYGQVIARTKNKPIISLRLFSPFGPRDHNKRLIPTIISKALKNNELNLSSPNIGRDFIFIDDVIDLYLKSISMAKKLKGEIFNVGSGIQSNISEVVGKIIELTNSKSKINWGSYLERDYDNAVWVADLNKTKENFSWEPKYSLKQGLKKTIEWFKSKN